MYYVWETRRRSDREVVVPQFAPTLKEHKVSFIAGRRVEKELPELELRFEASGDFVLTDDLIIRHRRCLVHSRHLTDVLKRAGVDSVDYHPCRVVNGLTGAIYRTHQVANLLDVIFCVDGAQSDIERDDEEPNEIWYIHRLKLMAERLGDSLMFRLGERRNTVIIHERVKEAIEKAGVSGPVFLPADGYREYPGYSSDDNYRNVVGTHDLDPDGPADADDRQPDQDTPRDEH